MNKEYITLSELTKEIYKEQFSSTQTIDDSIRKSISNKFNFLMNRVVMRSKLDWRFKAKDRIPIKDKNIVKALLIKSYYPLSKDDDNIFVDWFNDSIDETDFDRIIELGKCIEFLIKDEIADKDRDLDDVTKDEWVTAIHSSINFSRALSVKKFAYEMNQLYDSSNVLNHDIPLGDLIRENEYGRRSYLWKSLQPNIDMSLPLTACTYTEQVADYFNGQYQTITAVHQEDQGNSLYHAHIIINTTDVNNGKLYHSGRKELQALAMHVHDITGNYCKPIIKKPGE